jgi:hypothetical protein
MLVIAIYRPYPGTAREVVLDLIRSHNATLRVEGLITDRPAILAEAEDGALLEIFEWKPGASQRAHEHKAVQKIWKRMGDVAEFAPLISLQEAEAQFPAFKPINDIVT